MKAVLFRPAAKRDLDERLRHYRREAGALVARRLAEEFEAARRLIERHPAIGSPRLGEMLEVPQLRTWRVKGFPLLLMYLDRPNIAEVVRVLHERQDVAALLAPLLDDTP